MAPRYFYEAPLRAKGSGLTATKKIEKKLAEIKAKGRNPGDFEISFRKSPLFLPVEATKASYSKSVYSRRNRVNETMGLHTHPVHQGNQTKSIALLREEQLLRQVFGEKAAGIDHAKIQPSHNICPSPKDIANLIMSKKTRTSVVISLDKMDSTKVAGYFFIRKTPKAVRLLTMITNRTAHTELREISIEYQKKKKEEEQVSLELSKIQKALKKTQKGSLEHDQLVERNNILFRQVLALQKEMSAISRKYERESDKFTQAVVLDLKREIQKTGYSPSEDRAENAIERINKIKTALEKIGIQIRVVPNTKNGYRLVEKQRKTINQQHTVTRIEFEKIGEQNA
jgi:hypothetical protein